MNGRRRVARMVALGASAALLVVVWIGFAPRQLGGDASFVTTAGTSMEPLLQPGDLVVVRDRDPGAYRIGDVVAYRNQDLGQVILHRIVALDGTRFVLQGDHNTWIDSYRPAEEDLIGEMAFRFPALGRTLGAVRTPWGLSAVGSVAGVAVFGRRRRAKRDGEATASGAREGAPGMRSRAARAPTPPRLPARVTAHAAAVLAGVAALGLLLGAILFALPSTVTATRDVAYEQRGTFTYTGALPQEGIAVYGRERVETGDPIYLELTKRIEVAFEYELSGDAPVDASGSLGLVAELSDVNGWTRTVELAPGTPFRGGSARIDGVLDLRGLLAMTNQLERITGVERDHYTLALRPQLAIEARMVGRSVGGAFAPELRFLLDPLQLQMEPEAFAPAGEEILDPLRPVDAGMVAIQGSEPRTFSVFGFELGLGALRMADLALLLLALGGLVAIRLDRARSARRGEAALIESRYGQWLVPVRSGVGATAGRTVQLEDFDSLARLATHYGHVVLHEEGDGFHVYSVEENGVVYRYRVDNGVRA